MYTSRSYGVTDRSVVADFVDRHGFGTVVSTAASGLLATHVPMLWTGTPQSDGTLLGHMSRANPQHRIEEGAEVLAIFAGPNSYVSPLAYADEPDVPTWNYQSARLYGTWSVVRDDAAVRRHIEQMIAKYERTHGSDWTLARLEPALVAGLERGIVAFRIEVTRVECAFKLSQDRTPGDRRGVIRWLDSTPGRDRREVAAAMRQLYGYPER